MRELSKVIVGKFIENKNQPFLILDDESISYKVAYDNIQEYVKWMQESGIKEYDQVGVIFKSNCIEYIYTIIAAMLLDVVCYPIMKNFLVQSDNLPSIKWIISDEEISNIDCTNINTFKNANLFQCKIERENLEWTEQAAFVLPTSGTTGKVKWVVLSHLNILSNVYAIQEYIKPTKEDIFILLKHLGHISTITSDLLLCLFCGASLIVNSGSFSPQRANALIKKNDVTILTIVPTMLQLMLRYNPTEYLLSLKKISLIGGPSKPDLLIRAQKCLQNSEFYIGYGLTEASSRVTYLPADMLMEKLGSIGIPVKGITVELESEHKIIDKPNITGEVVVSGDSVMMGYLKNNRLNQEVKRLYTNDLAYRDNDGYYFHVGRSDDILVCNGNNVPAIVIEKEFEKICQVESAHAFIQDSDNLLTELLCLVVVLKIGENISIKEMYDFIKDKLPPEMIPKKIFISEEIPCNVSGKISRKKLAEKFKDWRK